jgi:hypothetical protein
VDIVEDGTRQRRRLTPILQALDSAAVFQLKMPVLDEYVYRRETHCRPKIQLSLAHGRCRNHLVQRPDNKKRKLKSKQRVQNLLPCSITVQAKLEMMQEWPGTRLRVGEHQSRWGTQEDSSTRLDTRYRIAPQDGSPRFQYESTADTTSTQMNKDL